MIACDFCHREVKGNNSVQTKEESVLGKQYRSFCNKDCLIAFYNQSPGKAKNEFWKFRKKKVEPVISPLDGGSVVGPVPGKVYV